MTKKTDFKEFIETIRDDILDKFNEGKLTSDQLDEVMRNIGGICKNVDEAINILEKDE